MDEQQIKESLALQLAVIRGINRRISNENTTQKTIGGKYPIRKGYSLYVRRPVQDIRKWMNGVEDLLETLIEELEK